MTVKINQTTSRQHGKIGVVTTATEKEEFCLVAIDGELHWFPKINLSEIDEDSYDDSKVTFRLSIEHTYQVDKECFILEDGTYPPDLAKAEKMILENDSYYLADTVDAAKLTVVQKPIEIKLEYPDENDFRPDQSIWEVVVDNVGKVFSGPKEQAQSEFDEWVEKSQSGEGRAGGENVTLLEDDGILSQYLNPGKLGWDETS